MKIITANGQMFTLPQYSLECKNGIETDAEWLEQNLGPFKDLCTFSELRDFNLSQVNAGSRMFSINPVGSFMRKQSVL